MPYPYSTSIPGLVSTVQQLRSVFPSKVTADTLKRWEIAPNNEAYVIGVLRFLGIIDLDGKKLPDAAKVFVEHDNEAFAEKFGDLVSKGYEGLFEHFGEQTWSLNRDRLIAFFRAEDESSSVVGARQARTFLALAGLAGHGEVPAGTQQPSGNRRTGRQVSGRAKVAKEPKETKEQRDISGEAAALAPNGDGGQGVRTITNGGLTIRIEINLPVTNDQAVYDKIFQSIRANLINE
jgi:hypothetical protein